MLLAQSIQASRREASHTHLGEISLQVFQGKEVKETECLWALSFEGVPQRISESTKENLGYPKRNLDSQEKHEA